MTLCELEAMGWLGWPDIVAGAFAAACVGASVVWFVAKRLHDDVLLAAYQLGKRHAHNPGDDPGRSEATKAPSRGD